MTDCKLQKLLISSMNLLCEYVKEQLPRGWQIELVMTSTEAHIALYDQYFEEVHVDSESGIRILHSMCQAAKDEDGMDSVDPEPLT